MRGLGMSIAGARRLAVIVLLLAVSPGVRAESLEELGEGGNLSPRARRIVEKVLAGAELVRDIPAEKFSTTMEIMDELFDHPVLTAGIARGMVWGDFRVSDEGGGLFAVREGDSIVATFSLIHRDEGDRLYYIEGQYFGSFFIHLAGDALLRARYRPAGERAVNVEADAALRVENRFHGFLVFLFKPLFGRLVDRRFARYMGIARKIAEAVADDPEAVYNHLRRKGALSEGNNREFRGIFLEKHGGGEIINNQ